MNEGHVPPRVSISIVTFNGIHWLRECLRSVLALDYPADRLEVYVVDNGSTDGSQALVRGQFPAVRLLENPVNNYCRAHNLALRASRGAFVALLNNDVTLDPGWLQTLLAALEADPRRGAVMGKLLFMDGITLQGTGLAAFPDFRWGYRGLGSSDPDSSASAGDPGLGRGGMRHSCFGEMSPPGGEADASPKLEERRRATGYPGLARGAPYDQPEELPYLVGTAVLFRRACLEAIGGLDEDFHCYHEDVDFSLRCRRDGWTLHYVPTAVARHARSGTFREQERHFLDDRNRLFVVAKHFPQRFADVAGRFAMEQAADPRLPAMLEEALAKLRREQPAGRVADTIGQLRAQMERATWRAKFDRVYALTAGAQQRVSDRLQEVLRDLEARVPPAEMPEPAIPWWAVGRALRRRLEIWIRSDHPWMERLIRSLMRRSAGVLATIFRYADALSARVHWPPAPQRPSPIRATSETPVSIVIPTWNRRMMLARCLDALWALPRVRSGRDEVIVVDDGSVDGTADMVRRRFPRARLVRLNRNRGFGYAANRGVKAARHPMVLLLNNDVVVTAGALERLLSHAGLPDVAAVTPRLFRWDGINPLQGVFEAEFRNGFLKVFIDGRSHGLGEPRPTLLAVGAACLMRRSDFFWLGGFDPIYRPYWWEDNHLCYQAWKRGLRVMYEPRAVMYHKLHGTIGAGDSTIMRRNHLVFSWIHLNPAWLGEQFRALEARWVTERAMVLIGYVKAIAVLPGILRRRWSEQRALTMSDAEVLARTRLRWDVAPAASPDDHEPVRAAEAVAAQEEPAAMGAGHG